MYFFAVAGMLLFMGAGVCAVILLVRKLMKRNIKVISVITLSQLFAGWVCLCAEAAESGLYMLFFMLAVSVFPAVFVLPIIGTVRKRRNRPARFFFLGIPVAFTLALGLAVTSGLLISLRYSDKNATEEDYEIKIETEYDFTVEDGTEPLEVITSTGCDVDPDQVYKPYRMVYDSCDLPYVLENCDATADDCFTALENNPEISEVYKTYFADFIRRIDETYPEADLSILCANLETLKVEELNEHDYFFKSLSLDSYGCYMISENTIYIPEGTEYIEGEWGFQVLIHEFCHAARTRNVKYEDTKDIIQFCCDYDNKLLEESMNSAFSCSLLNYYERDIAYQVPSNYLRIMLECMDNYTLADYINHSDAYFLSKLDEYTGYTNYAGVIWKLITLQRSDWSDDETDIPAEEYEPIYKFLADMYYDKYLTDDMTREECEAVAAELADKAFYDAPEDFKTDPEYFTEYLDEYMAAQSEE